LPFVSSYLPFGRQQRRKPPPGTARAGIVSAELFDQLSVDADDTIAAFDLGLARGNPLRRLLVGSKGRFGVELAVHVDLLDSGGRQKTTQRANDHATGLFLPKQGRRERRQRLRGLVIK
jgi:hypothetical protein